MILAASTAHIIWAFLFAVCAFFLMVVILLQRGRGVGLAGAFGGGATATFGAKTGDFLTWVTISIAGFMLLLACIMTKYVFVKQSAGISTPSISTPSGTAAPTPAGGAPAGSAPSNSAPVNPPPSNPPPSTPPSESKPGGWLLPRNIQDIGVGHAIFGEPTA